jgi:hypothetical protein
MNATMNTRAQSIVAPAAASRVIGDSALLLLAAGTPKIASATAAATIASKTLDGDTPAIHIIVVVVSPTTLNAPPALDARTIAAR